MRTVASATGPVSQGWGYHLRLVWTLAAKDIVDAIKTKSTLTAVALSFLMVFFYRYFPALAAGADGQSVLVYAAQETELLTALERSPALAVYTYDSRERVLEVATSAEEAELALIIPQTAIAQYETGEPIVLEGHLMYWLNAAERAEIKALVESELASELDRPVTLNLSGNDIYFDADQYFFVFSATIALLFVTIMIGISMVPNLMVEEKQTRTLDALLVSPAAPAHLVAGKALAGLFYGLLGCIAVFALFGFLILQWWLAILAAVLAVLLLVAVGLLLGSYVSGRSQLQLIGWFVVLPLLLPVVLVALRGLVPDGAVAVMEWIPTVLIATLFRLSLTPNVTISHYGLPLLVVVVSILVAFTLVVQLVRRQDRR